MLFVLEDPKRRLISANNVPTQRMFHVKQNALVPFPKIPHTLCSYKKGGSFLVSWQALG